MNKQLFTTNSFKVKAVSDDEDNREIDFIASKEIRDRQGEIISIKGMDLKNFKASPVILWSHNHNDLPIGKATKIYKSNDELHVRIEYAPPEVYSFADTVFKLTKGGYLSALSIGFLPDYSEVVYDDKKNARIYNKTELLEVSVVNVGANQAALRKAMDDGIIDELERKEFDIYCKKSNEFNSENNLNSEEIKNIKIEIDEIKTCINKVSEQVRKDSAAAVAANVPSQTDDYTEAEMEEIMSYFEYDDNKENK